ncbi:MAG TPA: hypothetical protein VLM40_10420 [Gemmata sp.]|nr:hypothetical protein [Gemmata sp.]
MVRKLLRAGIVAALGMLAVMASYGVATSANREDVDVGEIMSKSFGKTGFKGQVAKAVKGGKWEDAEKIAKEWNDLGVTLVKAKPPRGDAKSWEQHAKKFGATTKMILDGTTNKDAKATTKAIGSFNCMGCHKAHKGA